MSRLLVDQLCDRFEALHGVAPAAVFRSPGRVNLIGEHTDYSLLPVLPLAMEQATYVAVSPREEPLVVAGSLRFEGQAALGWDDPLGQAEQPWQRYLAGVMLVLGQVAGVRGRGARLLVHGDLPTTGGLSSSSSLTMGLLGALNVAWELGLSRRQLVQHGVVAERHVGVESGGMDQTVIGLAQAGAALRIDFAPPRTQAVPLPDQLRVVVASSGQEAPKGGAVRQAYNERVVGCRLAAALLAAYLGLEQGEPLALSRVAGRQGVGRLVEDLPGVATAAAVSGLVHAPLERLVQLTAGSFEAEAEVLVRPVARHVLGEAARVDRAQAALEQGDLEELGRLLNASHESLSIDYRCSTEALDRLCLALRGAGALGARLTGAGFGGYALAVTTPQRLEQVLTAATRASGSPALSVRPAAGMSPVRP